MKSKLVKISLLLFVFVFGIFSYLNPVNAVCKPGDSSSDNIKECLGLDSIKTPGILYERNPIDFITIVFQILLALVIILVVFRIVMSGIKVANAKEDPEKRNDGFKMLLNAVIGLAIALSAYGITMLVRNTFGGEAQYEALLTSCDRLQYVNKADDQVVERCRSILNSSGTGWSDSVCTTEWTRARCDIDSTTSRCQTISARCDNY